MKEILANRQYKRTLLFLCLLVFAMSVIFSFHYRIRPTVDAKAYNNIGWNIARGLGYIEVEQNASQPLVDDAIVRVGPGYEYFLATIYYIFGHHIAVVWIIQALLRAVSVLLVYGIAQLLFREKTYGALISICAAALFAITPDLIVMSGMLLAETLFITLLLAASYAAMISFQRCAPRTILVAGLLFGLAALVRPTALVVLFIYLGFLWHYSHRASFVGLALIFPVLFVGGWSLRNSLLYRTPLFTTTAGTYALWVGNTTGATGGYDKTIEIQEARNKLHSVPLAELSSQKYKEFIVKHPVAFVTLQIRKTAMYFSLLRPTGFWFYLASKPLDRLLTLVASGVATAALFSLGFIGMWALLRERWNTSPLFIVLTMLSQPLVVIPTYVETRYRYPAFPFLAIFVGYFVIRFIRERCDGQYLRSIRIPVVVVLAVLLLLTGIDVYYSHAIITERWNILF